MLWMLLPQTDGLSPSSEKWDAEGGGSRLLSEALSGIMKDTVGTQEARYTLGMLQLELCAPAQAPHPVFPALLTEHAQS